MHVVLALGAFSRGPFQTSLMREAGLFALDFSEQELGQRAMPVWLFDAEPVRIPPPRRETPEEWADRWLTLEPDGTSTPAGKKRNGLATASGHLFQGRRQLAPVQRAVAGFCAAADSRPTVALVFLTDGPLDEEQLVEAMRETAGQPVLWVFLTTARSQDAEPALGVLDTLAQDAHAPAAFTVIRVGGWSAWARLRRARGIRRAVSRWLRGLPPAVVEPDGYEDPEDDADPEDGADPEAVRVTGR
ncbi:hypothetical protein ACIBI4_19335 [Streptomyces sp. NPDC050418]|uniref:hypothetical protein n=1 Tax=Streptomyces sp. NPDC050418 TaxID=3365612 RepID=UPI0037A5E1DE